MCRISSNISAAGYIYSTETGYYCKALGNILHWPKFFDPVTKYRSNYSRIFNEFALPSAALYITKKIKMG